MHPELFAKFNAIVEPCLPFTAEDGQSFIRIPLDCGGHFSLPLRSRAFHNWYFFEFHGRYEYLPTPRQFSAIVDHLEGQANHYHEQRLHIPVYRRVGRTGPGRIPDRILLDLGASTRDYVEITPNGWKTTAGPDALFRTSRSTGALCKPVISPTPASQSPTAAFQPPTHSRSGEPNPQPPTPALEALRASLNLPSRADWLRCLAWLLAAFRPSGPFPILILQGPPNSGKSLTARILRFILDPCCSPLAPTPSSARDLICLARHNWILAFDHISTLSPLVADALCRLSAGLGATVREAPGPAHEPLLQYYRRPILLTVTSRWSCPPEIARRALTVTLPPLGARIRPEETVMAALDPIFPVILGALCTAVSTALARLPQMIHADAPATSALAWAMAASPALGCSEEEMQLAFAPAPPSHPIVEAVRNLVAERQRWTGTATQLLDLLAPLAPGQNPTSVSHHLRNSMLTLADQGIELKFRRLHGGSRIIDLHAESGDADSEMNPQSPSPDSVDSPQPSQTEEVKSS